MTKIAILASGSGTNMEAIIRRIESGDLKADLAFVASDVPDASALSKAEACGICTEILPYKKGKKAAESILNELWEVHNLDWLVLAGFMRILSPEFTKAHSGRIVNIHPALLPSFPGAHGIEDAWNYGVTITGVTVHLVDEKIDHGRILSQVAIPIKENDDTNSLEERSHQEEHQLYWSTLSKLFAGELPVRKDV